MTATHALACLVALLIPLLLLDVLHLLAMRCHPRPGQAAAWLARRVLLAAAAAVGCWAPTAAAHTCWRTRCVRWGRRGGAAVQNVWGVDGVCVCGGGGGCNAVGWVGGEVTLNQSHKEPVAHSSGGEGQCSGVYAAVQCPYRGSQGPTGSHSSAAQSI